MHGMMSTELADTSPPVDLDRLFRTFDYTEYGGAPLLGVNGGCIISHGRSNAKAIKNAIRVARSFAQNRVDTKIREKISDLHTREHDSGLLAST
jgi:glycerol-3-phosphate acyltransferase PlsX